TRKTTKAHQIRSVVPIMRADLRRPPGHIIRARGWSLKESGIGASVGRAAPQECDPYRGTRAGRGVGMCPVSGAPRRRQRQCETAPVRQRDEHPGGQCYPCVPMRRVLLAVAVSACTAGSPPPPPGEHLPGYVSITQTIAPDQTWLGASFEDGRDQ